MENNMYKVIETNDWDHEVEVAGPFDTLAKAEAHKDGLGVVEGDTKFYGEIVQVV
jgi:hypothetical protein